MRILLVQPQGPSGRVGFSVVAMPEPLGLECVAATVSDHEVAILDMRCDSGLEGALEAFAPDVVGVTALTAEVYSAQAVLQAAKAHAPEIVTVVGGYHATLLPEDFQLPYIDAICLGEGELVFPRLIEALAAGRELAEVPNLVWRDADGRFVPNGRTVEEFDLDQFPLPRRDLVSKHREQYRFLFYQPDVSVVTGRGCPFRCNFCSVWQFYGGRTCQLSAPRVVEELHTIHNSHVTFVDDNFLMNYRREMAIAERIKAEGIVCRFGMECRTDSIARHPDLVEKWAEVGLETVFLGLEASADVMLKRVNKKNTAAVNDEAIRILKANGVRIWGAFIVGPDWTAADFQALRDYVVQRGITQAQFTVLTPLPGTQLYRDEYARLLTHDYTCYDTLHAVVPTLLPREEFYRQLAGLYRPHSPSVYYDLVQSGQLDVEDCRRGKEMLRALSRWEYYLENDPVLGRKPEQEAPARP